MKFSSILWLYHGKLILVFTSITTRYFKSLHPILPVTQINLKSIDKAWVSIKKFQWKITTNWKLRSLVEANRPFDFFFLYLPLVNIHNSKPHFEKFIVFRYCQLPVISLAWILKTVFLTFLNSFTSHSNTSVCFDVDEIVNVENLTNHMVLFHSHIFIWLKANHIGSNMRHTSILCHSENDFIQIELISS